MTTLHAPHSTVTTTTNETIHTNKKHPFFTEEAGFVPVAQLKIGMHVLRADGRYGVITGYKLVPGAKTMYNLEVAQDHTFTVGVGQFVVHNSDTCGIASSGGLGDRNDAGNPSGFADNTKLTDHFNRHGSDFGATSKEVYQQQAIDFLSGVPDDSAVQLTRTNGDVVRWDPSTGEFGVVSSTDIVRTYYSIGERTDPVAYFLRQYW